MLQMRTGMLANADAARSHSSAQSVNLFLPIPGSETTTCLMSTVLMSLTTGVQDAKKVVGATFKHVAMVKLGSPIYYYKDGDGSEFYAFRKVPGAGEEGWKIMVIIFMLLEI